MEPVTFYINRLALEVYSWGHLVQVTQLDTDPPIQNCLSDLPDWVFRSRLAIWFVKGEEPIYSRAKIGDMIRKELMSEIHHPLSRLKQSSYRSHYAS